MSWLSDLFGGQSDKTQNLVNNLPKMKVYGFPDEPGFQQNYVDTITNRIAGRGVGYDQSFLDTATAPYAKDWRASNANYTIPGINTAASARGLGKSTIPVNQGRLASEETENKIGTANAQIQQANQEQKRNEINNAITQYYTYTKDDIGYKNMQSQADYANYLDQIGLSQQADQMRTKMMQTATESIGGAVYGGITGYATGNVPGMLAGIVGGGTGATNYQSDTINAYIKKLMGGNASTVEK